MGDTCPALCTRLLNSSQAARARACGDIPTASLTCPPQAPRPRLDVLALDPRYFAQLAQVGRAAAAHTSVLAPGQASGPQVLVDFSFPPSSPLIGIKPFCVFLSPVCPGASRHSELVFPIVARQPSSTLPQWDRLLGFQPFRLTACFVTACVSSHPVSSHRFRHTALLR